jgi:hypothetical protein
LIIPFPWSSLERVLNQHPKEDWVFAGCLGVQSRSLAFFEAYKSKTINARMLCVDEPVGSRWAERRSAMVDTNRRVLAALPVECAIEVPYVLGGIDEDLIGAVDEWLPEPGSSVVLDLTGLPDRALFWAVKTAFRRDYKALIVSYAVASGYSGSDLFSVSAPRSIAKFGGIPDAKGPRLIVASIGYEVHGLALAVNEEIERAPDWRVFMPQPSGPGFGARNWDVLRLSGIPELPMDHLVQHYLLDVPGQLRSLRSLASEFSTSEIVLLPFGPKPTSLAMSLLATDANVASRVRVVSAEPVHYNPDYTKGVARRDSRPEVYGFCLISGGRNLTT